MARRLSLDLTGLPPRYDRSVEDGGRADAYSALVDRLLASPNFGERWGQHWLDLARWIVDPHNPLTSRVEANRIWQHLFGKGLVRTPADFGTQGERPTHPELLDYPAAELIAGGWSRKHLIRLIVNSKSLL